MKCIIAGSRGLGAPEILAAALLDCGWADLITEVVSGRCEDSPDMAGEAWAAARGIPVQPFPFKRGMGRAGGPVRNEEMSRYGDALLAIWDGKSRGTWSMIRAALARGLKVIVYLCDLARRVLRRMKLQPKEREA